MSSNGNRRRGMVASAMRHKSITLLLTVCMMVAGIISLLYIPKDEFPRFNLPIGLVVGVYPGATESEVEEQLARPLEDFLWTFKEINKSEVLTISESGLCYAIIFLNKDVKDPTVFWSKLKERLPLLRLTLPPGVLGVVANDDFGDVSSMLIAIESEEKTYREINEYVERLSDRLRTIPSLANIYTLGSQKEQIGVYLDRNRLPAYGLNTVTVMSEISGQAGTTATGSFEDGQLSRNLHVVPSLNSEMELQQTIVYTDPSGTVVRLGDIAEIKREYPELKRYIHNNGNKCVIMSLQMSKGNNIVQFGKEVRQVLDDFKTTLPPEVQINTVTDQSRVVDDSVKEFLGELIIAIFSVIVVVMLMLPLRVAGVSVMTIPITIFTSIALFYALGIEINSVTLAALLVSLGMIIDDSVVVVDCYLDKLDEGMSRWQAAVESARQFTASIITATLAISITFFPLIFTTEGIPHDFILWFPYSLSIVLVVSLMVALFVVPVMEHRFIRQGLTDQKVGVLTQMQRAYNCVIAVCFRHRRLVVVTSLCIVVLSGFLALSLPQKLMPRATQSLFAVEIYLPSGADIHRTEQVTDSVVAILRKDKRITNITTFYGSGSPRFHVTFVPQFGGTHFAQLIVNTHSDSEMQEVLDTYTGKLATYFPEAQVLFKQIEYTDATYPVSVELTGYNLDSLHVATDSVANRLRRNPHLVTVNTSWGGTRSRINITMNPEESSRIGMSKTLLSTNLALRYYGGLPVTSIWEGTDEVPVVLKDLAGSGDDIESFKNIRVSGLVPTLTTVPLSQVATVTPDWADGAICHKNGCRMASVFATLSRDAKIGPLTREIYEDLETLRLPEGVTLSKGGQAYSENHYRPQLYLGMVIAIVLIFFILLFHLKSIPLTLLLMGTLLFSVPGAALGLYLMGFEVGATVVLGLISLMGLIVRCGIIMVDYSEELRLHEGMTVAEAAKTAAVRRFRPVFLTSAAASMGVIPMVIKATPLWGPMGVVICVGAIVSMLFIVTVIPVGYSLIMERKKGKVVKSEKEIEE